MNYATISAFAVVFLLACGNARSEKRKTYTQPAKPYGNQIYNPNPNATQQQNPYANYCYSWDCDTYGNSLTGQERNYKSSTIKKYGDRKKSTTGYGNVMKTSKPKPTQAMRLKAPSTCDALKTLSAEKRGKGKNNPGAVMNQEIPCVKLY